MKNLLFSFMLILMFVPAMAQTLIMKDTRFLREKMEKIAVLTQIPDDDLREKVEASILAGLEKKGVDAMSAGEFLIKDSTYLYGTLEREFKTNSIDGILIVKLVNIEITDMYIVPGDVLPPDAYNYFEYYSVYYYYDLPIIAEPGYLSRADRTFRIDMNLYTNSGDMIIFSAQTKLFDPQAPEKITKSIGKKIAKIVSSKEFVVRR